MVEWYPGSHNHQVLASSQNGESMSPQNAVLAGYGTSLPPAGPYTTSGANTTVSAAAVGQSGGNQPFSIIQPSLALNYIIAIEGIYPSRP
jgi:microcystin-dependent protein